MAGPVRRPGSSVFQSAQTHYPTMTSEEIMAFRVGGRPVREIANKDAVLFLWCTPLIDYFSKKSNAADAQLRAALL
jgi:N6-adenosine-specific RNA methylase IME4